MASPPAGGLALSSSYQPDLCAALGSPIFAPPGAGSQLIESIQQSAADIRMEAAALATASVCAGGKKRVSEAMRSAQASQEEARRILADMPASGGGSFSDARPEQGSVEKSLADASSAVTAASREYKAKQGLRAVAREVQDVSQAEVETHAELAEDYARDAVRVNTNVQQMNQVVSDLARITTSQGESVSNILSLIDSASESARDASREVVRHNERQQRTTKRMLQLVLLAVLLVVLIENRLLPQLLQFVTGSARVPVGGFRELVGFNGAKHPFTLARGSHLSPESLPMAHACICTLDLPPYKDYETCRAKMVQMLALGRGHFDDAAAHASFDDD
ncbi:unnamed protein product [Prorocentrum cordatum]|uniref:HECT-type E3 ubiquitin transferase n=1 Tax=Prorocentrum cordatum TaxID=2364126 RepID=A0ABN9X886_9DINO|nr:unnamed protein product [Polarella glacialis]